MMTLSFKHKGQMQLIQRSSHSSISTFLSVFIVILCGLVDIPNHFILPGGISMQAMLTILYASMIWLLWLTKPASSMKLINVLPFLFFIVWSFTSLLWFHLTKQGVQNIMVFAAFVGIILVVSRESSLDLKLVQMVNKYFKIATFLSIIIYLPTILADGLGSRSLIGSRSFALFALISLAFLLAEWRYNPRKIWFCASIGNLILIGLSLSRTALVTGVALTIISRYKSSGIRGFLKFTAFLFVSFFILYSLINNFAPLRDRFFEGDMSLKVGGVSINAMGRTALWDTILQSYETSPIIGKGAGASEEVIHNRFDSETQPHNDYLRILHDYGLIGITFWVIGIIGLLISTVFRWLRADKLGHSDARVHLAAFLAVIGIAFASVTDNTIVYIFVMAPGAVLIGTSLGRKVEV